MDTPLFLEIYKTDESTCDSLIELYKQKEFSSDKGFIGGDDGEGKLDETKKKCNQITLSPSDIETPKYSEYLKPYFSQLQTQLDQYIEKYQWCNMGQSFTLIENYNIQHYMPGDGYYSWHCEKMKTSPKMFNRHLVFMTYLNDVSDEDYNGGTEWLYQKFKTKPKKGDTIIWPVEWMFTHRGIVTEKSEKYIITGWLSFHEKN